MAKTQSVTVSRKVNGTFMTVEVSEVMMLKAKESSERFRHSTTMFSRDSVSASKLSDVGSVPLVGSRHALLQKK